MTDGTRDKVEGMFDEHKGKAKEQFGNMTDDDNKVADGQADQAEGEAKQGIGESRTNRRLKDKAAFPQNATNDHAAVSAHLENSSNGRYEPEQEHLPVVCQRRHFATVDHLMAIRASR